MSQTLKKLTLAALAVFSIGAAATTASAIIWPDGVIEIYIFEDGSILI